MQTSPLLISGFLALLGVGDEPGERKLIRLSGEVRDAATAKALPARIYIQAADGAWHFPRSSGGSAITYRKQRTDNPRCVEMHTTLSAHPFEIDLPPGQYTITVERGKEYHPIAQKVTLGKGGEHLTVPLRRWINLAERGWYSGETHLHRTLDE